MHISSSSQHSRNPLYTKLWLFSYAILCLYTGVDLYLKNEYSFPIIGFCLLNIYAITLLLASSRQGFYTLCGGELIIFIYSLIRHQEEFLLPYVSINLVLLLITLYCVRFLWKQTK